MNQDTAIGFMILGVLALDAAAFTLLIVALMVLKL
jgi:hypothetical protein